LRKLRKACFQGTLAVYTPVHPSVYPPATPTSLLCHHGYHVRHARCVIKHDRAVGLGAFRIVFIRVAPRNVTARLDRRLAQTTCVCQAKSIKRIKRQFYSGTSKRVLPQRSSFSGPRNLPCVERFTSVSQNVFSRGHLLFRKMFFSGKAVKKKVKTPFSYKHNLSNTLKHAFS